MAFTLPLPVRVAAGILATGIERVRSLPDDIPALPVTLVGNAMRLTMKVQQEIATLATRGDELLSGVIAAPQENPSWARFDDDEPTPSRTGRAGTRPVNASPPRVTQAPAGPTWQSVSGRPKKPNNVVPKVPPHATGGTGSDGSEPSPDQVTSATAKTDTASAGPAISDMQTLTTPDATSMPPVATTATDAAIDVPESLVELATEANEPPAEAEATPTVTLDAAVDVAELDLTDAAPDTVVFEETDDLTEQITVPAARRAEVEEASDGPAALPGYDLMTLAQVRGHLRELSVDDVTALLDYERLADNRAPFLTLLSNRLVTLDAQRP